jgi:hypothetical protein
MVEAAAGFYGAPSVRSYLVFSFPATLATRLERLANHPRIRFVGLGGAVIVK